MHRFSPLLVLLFAATAFAQSAQPAPASEQPGPANNYGFAPAPKPGHPLDPNDVAILTGKYDNPSRTQQQSYAAPQIYYSYPAGGSMFNQSTVGNAFGIQPNFSMGYGNNWRNRGRRTRNWGWSPYYGGYSNLNGSQFADVTTEAAPFRLRGRQKPGFGPTFFFGNRTPGFGNRWQPHFWSTPADRIRARESSSTGSKSSPGLRP